ncbi:putative transposase [Geobacillus kaustophilus]|uniref:Putative transposase n=1 Tax=Geobacillus kaustophilus TaxID=1462 RepID=A0A0D8BWN5_GEOKU|nr:putative transposase [Geobacillus kaustophilus]
MQEHFHFTTDQAKLQKQYAAIFCFVSAQLSLIQMYLHRRSRHLVKQEDEVVIAVHLLGKLLGFSSERTWHRFVTGNWSPMVVDFLNGPGITDAAGRLALRSNGSVMKRAKRGQHHA